MSVQDEVLRELEAHRGECVSGEALAGRLSVSRNAVWKAIRALREAGYPIDAQPGSGYALSPGCHILSTHSVARYLRAPGVRLQVEGEVDSTNACLRRAADAGEPEGLVLLASAQTAGRGRHGRRFYSPAGSGLYMSALLRPQLPAQDAALMTTLAAVAVAEAVEAVSGRPAGIKWVNDVYVGGKKVCGILTEASLDCESGALAYAIVGIGINLTLPQTLPPELQNIMGAVFAGAQPEGDAASRLAGDVWTRFFRAYRRLPETAFLEAYRARSILIGQDVDVLRPSGPVPARAIGIDAHAGLIVRYPDGTQETLSSGEVSVRRAR